MAWQILAGGLLQSPKSHFVGKDNDEISIEIEVGNSFFVFFNMATTHELGCRRNWLLTMVVLTPQGRWRNWENHQI
jgi:hypothetical protein